MVFYELIGMAVRFILTELVHQRLGLLGLLLVALAVVAVRAGQLRQAWWAPLLLFVMLMLQGCALSR
ncbi:hypothetical protein O1Q96_42605 [Streptomyces sp. Qhu-G9]|uniref:hypothetical protein n=1 Tax=Streptomyces sp. Qhu-G9 TaxID=3452799 RepID=UPI0022AC52E0|nr:hypothetical protein [Streptomyces aurantiacus]WAU85811.1 hypothetical protein O1Q96_42605 [Streptomyces aurantiacus]